MPPRHQPGKRVPMTFLHVSVPRPLRKQLEAAAARHARSLTAEIVYRLTQSLTETRP
jgi:hypothetical protein